MDIILDSLLDTLCPAAFLFGAYLLIGLSRSYLASFFAKCFSRPKLVLFMAIIGGLLPQCGFAALAAAFYTEGLLTAGTLIAVFLATSDEALPLLLAQSPGQALKLITVKAAIALFWGCLYNHLLSARDSHQSPHCLPTMTKQSFKSIVHDAWHHTLEISAFVFLILLALNLCTANFLAHIQNILSAMPFLQIILASLTALLPGCAPSVFITQLYIAHVLSFAAAVAALSVGSGVGYLVLYKNSTDRVNALKIVFYTFLAAIVSGLLLQIFFPGIQ